MRQAIKIRRQDAESVAAEERSWKCESCDKMIEEHGDGPHCRHCAMYWEDVRKGVFGD
ncbi:hypothetical protein EV129_11373 [Rhizobium azibense]|uniref:Uncharacterized protein n=1 Tax=Rhizobium azibense TaxID=1136135 RepID=A0A4R3REX3_9HYPH|nr:hypothetical protein EV129_11373 [Rhizobium azibense]